MALFGKKPVKILPSASATKADKGVVNPLAGILLADLALRAGGSLMRRTVEKGLLSKKYSSAKATDIVKGRTMAQTLISTALARVATRSVPGALIVGGGLLAKALYDKRQADALEVTQSEQAVTKQADRGRAQSE